MALIYIISVLSKATTRIRNSTLTIQNLLFNNLLFQIFTTAFLVKIFLTIRLVATFRLLISNEECPELTVLRVLKSRFVKFVDTYAVFKPCEATLQDV